MKPLRDLGTWACVLFVLSGCGGASAEKLGPELRKFAMAYHEYAAQKGQGPTRLEDLASRQPGFPTVAQMINDGKLKVIWGAKLFADSDKNDGHVLAYEKAVSQKGGLVLMAGGLVRNASAVEYPSLPHIPTKEN